MRSSSQAVIIVILMQSLEGLVHYDALSRGFQADRGVITILIRQITGKV